MEANLSSLLPPGIRKCVSRDARLEHADAWVGGGVVVAVVVVVVVFKGMVCKILPSIGPILDGSTHWLLLPLSSMPVNYMAEAYKPGYLAQLLLGWFIWGHKRSTFYPGLSILGFLRDMAVQDSS